MKNRFHILIITFTFFIWSVPASSASSQAVEEMQFSPEEIADFAKKVEKTLAAKGARVFLISRIGRPQQELPRGINYTHTGFGVYSMITTADGRKVPGYAMYNLYQKNDRPDTSHLVTDYPLDFFSGVYELKAGIIIPTPEVQKRLLKMIGSDTYRKLHNPKYSAISNPFNTTYQNCTEYTLDVINAAVYDTSDIEQIKANTKAYFDPQPVNVGPFKLLFGSMFMPDISISDHDENVVTATYTTIANYMGKYDMVQEQFTLTNK